MKHVILLILTLQIGFAGASNQRPKTFTKEQNKIATKSYSAGYCQAIFDMLSVAEISDKADATLVGLRILKRKADTQDMSVQSLTVKCSEDGNFYYSRKRP